MAHEARPAGRYTVSKSAPLGGAGLTLDET